MARRVYSRDTQITIRIAAPLRAQLDAVAAQTGQTVSDLARDILTATMAELVVGLEDRQNEATHAQA
jgi:antitoxin component of RelBE/YafQ-DinJ toxin-antitoxin module